MRGFPSATNLRAVSAIDIVDGIRLPLSSLAIVEVNLFRPVSLIVIRVIRLRGDRG